MRHVMRHDHRHAPRGVITVMRHDRNYKLLLLDPGQYMTFRVHWQFRPVALDWSGVVHVKSNKEFGLGTQGNDKCGGNALIRVTGPDQTRTPVTHPPTHHIQG